MTNRQKFRRMMAYPGNFVFSVVWAWQTRRSSRKPLVQRMLDAVEDAMDVL